MYQYIKDRGYAIYPGKVTDADTFRIGNIGEIYKEDILKVCGLMKDFLDGQDADSAKKHTEDEGCLCAD